MSATSPAITVHHAGREEITLRLGEDMPGPAEREPPQPVAGADLTDSSILFYFAQLLRAIGVDPAALLQREVLRVTRQSDEEIGRLLESIDREYQIRRAAATRNLKGARGEAERTTGEKQETHRKNLDRLFRRFVWVRGDPQALVEYLLARSELERAEQGSDARVLSEAQERLDRVKRRLKAPALERVVRRAGAFRVGQFQMSHEKLSTGGGSAGSPLDDDRQRREGDISRGTTQEHRGGQLAPATQTSDAQELPLKGQRTGVHQAEREPRGLPDRRPERLDRVPTPHEHKRHWPRSRRVRRRRRD